MSDLLQPVTSWIAAYAKDLGVWFLFCYTLFAVVTFFFPAEKSQRIFRKTAATDALYFLIGPLFYRPLGTILAALFLVRFYDPSKVDELHRHGLWPLNHYPVWAQVVMLLLITDFLQYWIHRFSHHAALLWRFHAVHHSSRELDWLSASRWHPVNHLFHQLIPVALIASLGFSPAVFLAVVPFYALGGFLVHANLPWTYGPLRYVIVSPVFHRWHHTSTEAGGNKNFAPFFSAFDWAFGTFYMPEGKSPKAFGLDEDTMGDNIVRHLAIPFLPARFAQKHFASSPRVPRKTPVHSSQPTAAS